MQRLHRVMDAIARAFAIIGGAVLLALILMTCASVAGRAINTILHSDPVQATMGGLADAILATGVGPILGDFEVVESGIAFAIFAFIPLCQITGGHATVDVFTSAFPTRVNRLIQMVADILFALVLILIAWRLYEGMQDKLRYGETTFMLQIPVWWSYAASLAAAVAAASGVYVAALRVVEFLSGHAMLLHRHGGRTNDRPGNRPDIVSRPVGADIPAHAHRAGDVHGGAGRALCRHRRHVVALAKLKSETYSTFSSYSLSIVPMFLLMGHFATLGGMSTALFKAAEAWLGHRRGGVAMAAVGACAGFGAICGSSLATAATMSQVALPELRRYGYSGGFSTATLAAGGTLGILIPPSVILVIYAILTEQNIAKLFLSAFIPGLLAALGYMLTISLYVRFHPGAAGVRDPMPYRDGSSRCARCLAGAAGLPGWWWAASTWAGSRPPRARPSAPRAPG